MKAWQTSKQVGALPGELMFSLRFRGQFKDLHLRENLEESTEEGVGEMKEVPQKQDQASQGGCLARGQKVVLVEVSVRGEEILAVGVCVKLGDHYLKMSLKGHEQEDRAGVSGWFRFFDHV